MDFPVRFVHPDYGYADAFCTTEAEDYIKRGFVKQEQIQEEATHDPDVAP